MKRNPSVGWKVKIFKFQNNDYPREYTWPRGRFQADGTRTMELDHLNVRLSHFEKGITSEKRPSVR